MDSGQSSERWRSKLVEVNLQLPSVEFISAAEVRTFDKANMMQEIAKKDCVRDFG